jgi:hypothetical protein
MLKMKKILGALLLMSWLVAACETTLATSTPSPAATVTPIQAQAAIAVTARVSNAKPVYGEAIKFVIDFAPVLYHATYKPDGTILATSATRLDSLNVAEMQMCYAAGGCSLSGQWTRFASGMEISVRADWLGAREYEFRAQMRDANGTIIPAYRDSYVGPKDEVVWKLAIEPVLDERTPVVLLPPNIQTAVAVTRAAFPVSGTVRIADGRQIIGATAGSTVRVRVEFTATSPFGPVREMRVATFGGRICADEKELASSPWQPLVAEKFYTITIPINFSSFDASVQYRDDKGNLSRIICGDLVIEGMPPLTITRSP